MARKDLPDILGAERQRINVLDDVLSGKPVGTDTALIRSQLRYDYSLIPETQREAVQDAAVDIVRHGKRAQESLILIGERLIEIKAVLEHGQFGEWCETEFSFSQRTAQNMMNVAQTFGGQKRNSVSLLGDATLYLLSAPSTPVDAREEVIELAQATGIRPTKAKVKEIIDSHKPAPAVVASAATGSRQQGAQLATCRICHRPLSDPASAANGIGPCCAGRVTTAAGSADTDDDDDQPLQLDTVEDDDLDILMPDRNEPTSAAQKRNERIDRITRALNAALDAVSEYEAVTGAYTHTPALRRAIEPMLRTLEGNRI